MGLFGFGKKKDKISDSAAEKAVEIERNIWELENKQILYLDKIKQAVLKQAEYKDSAKKTDDKNMQKHYANLYLSAEKEKGLYANSLNEISKEILTNRKMAQLVDAQTLYLDLEKMQTISLEDIERMSASITKTRGEREIRRELRDKAIDKALGYTGAESVDSPADELLSQWATEEKIEEAAEKARESERIAYEEELRKRIEREFYEQVNAGKEEKKNSDGDGGESAEGKV